MGSYCPRLERKARMAEAWFKNREKRSFRRCYYLDVCSLANAWLAAVDWQPVFFLSDSEWSELTGSSDSFSRVVSSHFIDGYSDPESRCVYINQGGSSEKTRFTVAHELGHVLLHRKSSPDFKTLPPEAEAEANEFARLLLVPPGLAWLWLTANGSAAAGDSQAIAQQLAQDFGVSTRVAAKTLKTLGFRPDEMERVFTAKDYQFPQQKMS